MSDSDNVISFPTRNKQPSASTLDMTEEDWATYRVRDEWDRMDVAAEDAVDAALYEVRHGHPPITETLPIPDVQKRKIPSYQSLEDIRKNLGEDLRADPEYDLVFHADPAAHDRTTTELLAALIRAELIIRVECTTTEHLFYMNLAHPAAHGCDTKMQLQHDLIMRRRSETIKLTTTEES